MSLHFDCKLEIEQNNKYIAKEHVSSELPVQLCSPRDIETWSILQMCSQFCHA